MENHSKLFSCITYTCTKFSKVTFLIKFFRYSPIILTHHGTYLQMCICDNLWHCQSLILDFLKTSQKPSLFKLHTFLLRLPFIQSLHRDNFFRLVVHNSVGTILGTMPRTVHSAITCNSHMLEIKNVYISLHYYTINMLCLNTVPILLDPT